MTHHTPEPWRIKTEIVTLLQQTFAYAHVFHGGYKLATVFDAGRPHGAANARLISTAPQMYEMLKGVLGLLEARPARLPAEILMKSLIRILIERVEDPTPLAPLLEIPPAMEHSQPPSTSSMP